jgi:F0F1-type ATP synthase assembly protein I
MADRPARTRQLAEVSILGIMFPLCIAAGYFLGTWLDGRFQTYPWLTFICSGLGVAAAFVNLFRVVLKSDDGTSKRS